MSCVSISSSPTTARGRGTERPMDVLASMRDWLGLPFLSAGSSGLRSPDCAHRARHNGGAGLTPSRRGMASPISGPLVAGGPLEQLVDARTPLVDAGVQVAELGEARRHGRHRAVGGLDVVDLVPRDRRRDRRRRARRAPSRRRPSCGPGRSGCSRRTASPDHGPCATTSWSPSRRRRRSTSRANASAADRTSANPNDGSMRT